MFRKNLCTFALVALAAPLFAVEWSTDFEASKAQARQENKAVLLDFTGSDWCGCCIQLRKTVLDTPQFDAYAKDKFVCMEVDMPRGKALPEAVATQNKELCDRYTIRFFPTILVLSPEGDVLGGFIGGGYNTDSVHKPLDAALANLPKLQAARAAQGVERAKGLAEISRSLPKELKEQAQSYRAEIETNDPEDVCGFRTATAEEERENFLRQLHAAGADYKRVLALVDARLPKVEGKEKADVLRIKGMALAYAAKSEADLEQAKQVLTEAAGLMGGTRAGDMLRQYIDEQFRDIPALLQELKKRQEEENAEKSEMDSLPAKLQSCGSDLRAALKLVDGQLALGKAEQKAELLRMKAVILMNMAESEQDLEVEKATFLASAEAAGDTPGSRQLRRFVHKEFSRPAALLERLKQNR